MLYTGLKKIEVTPETGKKVPEAVGSELTKAVSVAPNNAIFGSPSLRWPFPVGLWVWNNWDDPGKGLKHWLYDRLATEPVLVSDVRPEARVKMLDEILDNNGYFRGGASYELVQGKNTKKAKILYEVSTGPAAGHVNPALALAGLIAERRPDSEILFVGADRKSVV